MAAIGKKVEFIGSSHRLQQPAAQFFLEEAHDATDFLKREPPPLEIANDGDFGQIIQRVNAPVSQA